MGLELADLLRSEQNGEKFVDIRPDVRGKSRIETSLNRESRSFFLGDNSIWSFPSVSSPSDTPFGGPEGYFSPTIIAFGAFEFVVPIYYYRLGKMEKGSPDSLI